jgi:hypothetical protein
MPCVWLMHVLPAVAGHVAGAVSIVLMYREMHPLLTHVPHPPQPDGGEDETDALKKHL